MWEPFILDYDNKINSFYLDQRDAAYGQRLAFQSSQNLTNWGPVIDSVA